MALLSAVKQLIEDSHWCHVLSTCAEDGMFYPAVVCLSVCLSAG